MCWCPVIGNARWRIGSRHAPVWPTQDRQFGSNRAGSHLARLLGVCTIAGRLLGQIKRYALRLIPPSGRVNSRPADRLSSVLGWRNDRPRSRGGGISVFYGRAVRSGREHAFLPPAHRGYSAGTHGRPKPGCRASSFAVCTAAGLTQCLLRRAMSQPDARAHKSPASSPLPVRPVIIMRPLSSTPITSGWASRPKNNRPTIAGCWEPHLSSPTPTWLAMRPTGA